MASIKVLQNKIAKRHTMYIDAQEELRAELSALTGWEDLSVTHYSDGSVSVFTDSDVRGTPLDVFLERVEELKVSQNEQ